MSNVLIGVVGVILLIGLALAGAFYLGSSWRTAERDSRALRALEQINQIAAAAVYRQIRDGLEIPGNANIASVLVGPQFLKIVPPNPYSGTYGLYQAADVTGTGPASVVLGSIGINEEACQTIEARVQLVTPPVPLPVVTSTTDVSAGILRSSGCFVAASGIPHLGVPAGGHVVYARI